jgi:hypothetical protein
MFRQHDNNLVQIDLKSAESEVSDSRVNAGSSGWHHGSGALMSWSIWSLPDSHFGCHDDPEIGTFTRQNASQGETGTLFFSPGPARQYSARDNQSAKDSLGRWVARPQ